MCGERLPGADTLSAPRIHKLKKKKLFVGSDSSCHICVPDENCAKRQALIYSGTDTHTQHRTRHVVGG